MVAYGIRHSNAVKSNDVTNIVKIEQSAYESLVGTGTEDPNTLYIVVPDSE